ncbi:MAG: DRTGG domain-containing protein [Acidobacteria bacterium]|nr:DRTGG domain-containing protein [Acidobacteriota bacterium]
MTVAELATLVDGAVLGAEDASGREVSGGYASDLLSDVMANAQDGDAWVTLQRHVNTIAVAQLKNLSAIVVVNGRQPEAEMLARAVEHQVPVVSTPLAAFDVAGRLYEHGIRGRRTL